MSNLIFGNDVLSAVVVDIGGGYSRFGYAGQDAPKSNFPTLVGVCPGREPSEESDKNDSPVAAAAAAATPAKESNAMDVEKEDEDVRTEAGSAAAAATAAAAVPTDCPQVVNTYHIGNEAMCFPRKGMALANPIHNGLISDWDSMERVWDHGLKTELRLKPSEHPIMMSEPSFNSRAIREKTCELMFEKYEVPALFMSKTAVLSCFANARGTALVYDSGATMSSAVPVHDGWVIPKGIVRCPVGGRLMDRAFLALLENNKKISVRPRFTFKKQSFPDGSSTVKEVKCEGIHRSYFDYRQLEIVRDLRESMGQVHERTFDYATNANIPATSYHLPDGQEVKLGVERFSLPELLMVQEETPATKGLLAVMEAGIQFPLQEGDDHRVGMLPLLGAHVMVHSAIEKAGMEYRRELLSNILLVGGHSCYTGLDTRLTNELKNLSPMTARVKVIAPGRADRSLCSWIGGSILGSLNSFHEMWMSKAEYAEHGAHLVERKCP